MSAGFTPGPWCHSPTDHERHAVVSPPLDAGDGIGPWFTAIVQCADDTVEDANARLIAAAPELYEALESIAFAYHALHVTHDVDPEQSLALRTARAALAKARGEQVQA